MPKTFWWLKTVWSEVQWQYISADRARSPKRKATGNHIVIILGDHAFAPAGLQLWNGLPTYMHQLDLTPDCFTMTFKALHTDLSPYLSDLLQHHEPKVSALIQFSSALSPPPQINIWISCFSVFCSKSLELITCQYS